MKKVIVFLVIVSTFALAEVWDVHHYTSLDVSNAQEIKLFQNSFGNNIIDSLNTHVTIPESQFTKAALKK
jgi:hypothetical protein